MKKREPIIGEIFRSRPRTVGRLLGIYFYWAREGWIDPKVEEWHLFGHTFAHPSTRRLLNTDGLSLE